MANLTCDNVVVPGKDLYLHAARPQGRNRSRTGFLGRVKKCDVAEQSQVALVGNAIRGLFRRHRLIGYRNDPEAICVEPGRGFLRFGEVAFIEQAFLAADGISRADRKNLLDRSLTDQDVCTVTAREHNRHPTALEVERHLVDFLVLLMNLELLFELDVLEHGNIEQVLEAGLIEAVQIGIFKNLI
ncbi:hypothetical protein AWB67_06783 [Caballeronia terrestris]|uniref:Uncharacterized protein n=1 Tax=Caballeronia terrestris TaxID=1226301 RepID=A0A158KUJ8_9BURK|nr:hypothetical protein AWB67_06783 [Caballeronia terrestris]